jgi:hypothetical protein
VAGGRFAGPPAVTRQVFQETQRFFDTQETAVMKIQVIKKATPRAGADVNCPYFIDTPPVSPKKS